jgi:hypothetical protein
VARSVAPSSTLGSRWQWMSTSGSAMADLDDVNLRRCC